MQNNTTTTTTTPTFGAINTSAPQQQSTVPTGAVMEPQQQIQQVAQQQIMVKTQSSLDPSSPVPATNANNTAKPPVTKENQHKITNYFTTTAASASERTRANPANENEPNAKRPKLLNDAAADVSTNDTALQNKNTPKMLIPPDITSTNKADNHHDATTIKAAEPKIETEVPKTKEQKPKKPKPATLWKDDDVIKLASSQSSLAHIQTLADGAVEVDDTYRNKPRIQLLLQRYKCAYKAGVAPEVFAMRLSSILGLVRSNDEFLNPSKDANFPYIYCVIDAHGVRIGLNSKIPPALPFPPTRGLVAV